MVKDLIGFFSVSDQCDKELHFQGPKWWFAHFLFKKIEGLQWH